MKLPQPSNSEIEAQFMEFLSSNNLAPAGSFRFIINGTIQRYRLEGDSPSEKSGSYCIYTDRDWPIGWVMDWHVGEKLNWFHKTDGLNPEQEDYLHSKEFKQKVEAAQKNFEAQLKQRHDAAAGKARIYVETLPEASETHPYLQKKRVYAYGVKDNGSGSLVVPIRDIDGNIRSLQWIAPEGDKKLYPEASTKGCFWSVGMDLLSEHPEFPILLGEGFATMAKVYELTGYPSVAGISCSGLKGVAYALKGKYPNSKIIVMADNDNATEQKSGRNPGIDAAMELVKLGVCNAVIYPEFTTPEDGTDWDDYAIVHGDEETAKKLQARIRWESMSE